MIAANEEFFGVCMLFAVAILVQHTEVLLAIVHCHSLPPYIETEVEMLFCLLPCILKNMLSGRVPLHHIDNRFDSDGMNDLQVIARYQFVVCVIVLLAFYQIFWFVQPSD